ncbi:MAG: hypothetical protein LBS36_06610, partial [Oscillospiraceae bacterium]|nr:hypothetical protein [Oscillospiraceae bacterium]
MRKRLTKPISILLAFVMLFTSINLMMPVLAEAAASQAQIDTLKNALAAFVNSGETGSYNTTGALTNGSYVVNDNTSKGYVYKVSTALAPVFAGEMTTEVDAGNNWWTIIRARIKSLTGYSSGAGATLIDVLVPIINDGGNGNGNHDRNNKWEKKGDPFSTPGTWFVDYGNITVKVRRTLDAAFMDYSTAASIPSTLDIAFQYYCNTGEGTSTRQSGLGNINRYRRQWYYFSSGLTYGVVEQNTTAANLFKNAHAFFTPALVGQTTFQLIESNTSASIATLRNTANTHLGNIAGLGVTAATQNYFFTNPTLSDISAFMTRASVAQEVITFVPFNEWFEDRMAQGYDAQDYATMTAWYSTAVAYYNQLSSASADAKAVLAADYGMNLANIQAWNTQLLDDIQLYELHALKVAIDAKVIEVNSYRIPSDQIEENAPHIFFGDAQTAYTNTQLDVAAGQFAGWLSAVATYKTANINAVFTEGTSYISSLLAEVRQEINVRSFETVYAQFYEYFLPLFAKDLTVIASETIYGTMIPDAQSQRAAFITQYNNAVSIIGQPAVNVIFGDFGSEINAYIDSLHKELETRITAEVTVAYNYYTAYNQITYENFTFVKDAIGRIESDVYTFLQPTSYVSADIRAQYNALNGAILGQYNSFIATGGFSIYQQKTLDGGTGVYYTREAMGDDIARDAGDPADNYNVTDTALVNTIKKLDDFLLSDDFLTLTGSEESIPDTILNMISEELFTDEMVNSLMTALYPMLVETFNDL